MYDVTSGQILIDGVPIQDYKVADLLAATASLTQDHNIFPFSLAENIGLGYLDNAEDMEMIKDSAKQGGASELIAGFTDGLATTLEPIKTAFAYDIDGPKYEVLKEMYDQLELTTAVSGVCRWLN